MEERLKKQLEFILEADKVNLSGVRRTFLMESEKKMMQNIPGIWRL